MELENAEIISAIIYTFFAFLMMSIAILIFVYYSRKKIIEQEIKTRDLEIEHQKTLINAVINTQEKERNRIAQDLHDDISSRLNVVTINCHMLKTPGLDHSEQGEISDTILELTDRVLQSSRRIAHDLLPPVLDKFGLDAGIEELADDFNKTEKLKIDYKNETDFAKIPVTNHLHIFRILQELINNSMKHGKATEVLIHFAEIKNCTKLLYKDNGCGFNPNDLENQKGLGMKNIESRIALIGATYKIVSSVNKGIEVQIEI
jgi:two-component system, NarL family, sensor kinase